MAFDPRIVKLEPFVPHTYETLVARHALPTESYDQTLYGHVLKSFGRVKDQAIERLEYTVDGLRVTGALTRPATIENGTHPILIFNRGGSGDYGMLTLPGLLRYHLPFAKQGYLVFASNYRGNDGGEGAENFGGDDIHDVLELLDIAKQHPGWDGKNIFMLGGSRGGLMTYLSIKNGAPLNAAASFAGVADLFDGDGKWPELVARFAAQVGGEQPNIRTLSEERSAICWPEKLAHVPLLLMHGDADTVVSVAHSQKLSAELKTIGAPHKLVIYPGGNHSLSTHVNPMIEEVLGWFTAHRA